MKIKTVVEKADGSYEYQAELTAEQHAFLIEYAVRSLIEKGLIPFNVVDVPPTTTSVVTPVTN